MSCNICKTIENNNEPFIICGLCQKTKYCSIICQSKDWKHKVLCCQKCPAHDTHFCQNYDCVTELIFSQIEPIQDFRKPIFTITESMFIIFCLLIIYYI
jgi:hypothetical protein